MNHAMSSYLCLPIRFVLIALLSLVVAQACGPDLQNLERKRYKSAPGDNPHDTDSLYVLTRRLLTDEDPRSTYEAFLCQTHLLEKRIGFDEANRRMAVTIDTALRNTAEEKRWARLRDKVPPYPGEPDSLCARTAARARGDTTHVPIAP